MSSCDCHVKMEELTKKEKGWKEGIYEIENQSVFNTSRYAFHGTFLPAGKKRKIKFCLVNSYCPFCGKSIK